MRAKQSHIMSSFQNEKQKSKSSFKENMSSVEVSISNLNYTRGKIEHRQNQQKLRHDRF